MTQQRKYAFDSPSIQKALNIFAFLLAFPGIEVLGNSLYFYVFLWILYKTYKRTGKAILKSRFAWLLFISWIFGVISTFFHPPLMPGTYTHFGMALMVIRYAYWFAIGAYFYSWVPALNLLKIAKWIAIGYITQAIGFYLLSFRFDAVVFSFSSALTRNAFVFNSILFSGIVFFYFYNRYGRKSFWPVAVFVLLNLLLTNGRAGAVIAVLVVLLNYTLLNPAFRKLSKLGILVLFVLSMLSNNLERTAYSYGAVVAPYVENVSPRFANLLRGVDEGDLDRDKSWLIRELMVDKTIEIVRVYPFMGVGYGNFSKYEATLSSLQNAKYDRLRGRSSDFYNTRSAHNSYANHLGETGLIGFMILLLLILPIVFWFVKQLWTGNYLKYGFDFVILIGLIGGLIHGYAISAFTGANLWFMLGLGRGIMRNNLK